MTFTKTNFTGYSIQIRGIGTQAISVTTDPAVAVALNDIPFIRNHFFEQEFYDSARRKFCAGRRARSMAVMQRLASSISQRPSRQTNLRRWRPVRLGNYHQRRFEGMINIPVVDDRLDIRIAGEWTKRQGYSFNELTDQRIDGRDLWSGRVTIGFKPFSNVQTYLVWEHFSEDDDRMRTSKQLCKTDPIKTEINGVTLTAINGDTGGAFASADYLSQGCQMSSLYSADAFEVPNGYSLTYYTPLSSLTIPVRSSFDPYASTTQSQNLRVIESSIDPVYKAKNDVLEFNADYAINPSLTLTSQTGFNHDYLWSTEDYNRFNTQPGAFSYAAQTDNQIAAGVLLPDPNGLGVCAPADGVGTPGGCANGLSPGAVCKVGVGGCAPNGVFCDPQLGCSDRLVAEDLSDEHAWQLSQEFRLTSNFSGPLNFSVGGNYLHYETEENYYVFINALTLASIAVPAENTAIVSMDSGVSDNHQCLQKGLTAVRGGFGYGNPHVPTAALFRLHLYRSKSDQQSRQSGPQLLF